MLAIDTNVLVRFLVRDDEQQFLRVTRLIEDAVNAGEPILVSSLVLLETEWVLRSRYRFGKPSIAQAISRLLSTRELVFDDEETIEEALDAWRDRNADFADCMIVAKARRLGCSTVMTFDVKAAQLPGATLLTGQCQPAAAPR